MALIIPTSGPYTSLYTPHFRSPNPGTRASLGLMRSGWELHWDVHTYPVNDTTSWGKTLIELIYLGADWRLKAQALEYSVGALTEAAWAWNGGQEDVGELFNVVASNIGQRATNASSGGLILTAVAGPPAQSSPGTLTADNVVTVGGSFGMDSRLREIPIDFRLLPTTTTPDFVTQWFTTS